MLPQGFWGLESTTRIKNYPFNHKIPILSEKGALETALAILAYNGSQKLKYQI